MKKTAAYILTIIGTILSVLALVFYSKASATNATVRTLNICALVLCAAFLVIGFVNRSGYLSLLVSAAAVLMMGAAGYSLVTEVEVLGYLISGLRTWADVQFWAYFAGCALASWLILLVASFTRFGQGK